MVEKKDVKVNVFDTLAKIVSKDGMTAVLEAGGYVLSVHYPTIEEDIKIMAVAENLRQGVANPSQEFKLMNYAWATLEVATDKLIQKDKGIVFDRVANSEDSFMTSLKSKRDSSFYGKVILPLYSKFIDWQDSFNLSGEEIKNS